MNLVFPFLNPEKTEGDIPYSFTGFQIHFIDLSLASQIILQGGDLARFCPRRGHILLGNT
jgi:hypothetical protein